jgi:hypothetical protein
MPGDGPRYLLPFFQCEPALLTHEEAVAAGLEPAPLADPVPADPAPADPAPIDPVTLP